MRWRSAAAAARYASSDLLGSTIRPQRAARSFRAPSLHQSVNFARRAQPHQGRRGSPAAKDEHYVCGPDCAAGLPRSRVVIADERHEGGVLGQAASHLLQTRPLPRDLGSELNTLLAQLSLQQFHFALCVGKHVAVAERLAQAGSPNQEISEPFTSRANRGEQCVELTIACLTNCGVSL